jgi:hypothetical protein
LKRRQAGLQPPLWVKELTPSEYEYKIAFSNLHQGRHVEGSAADQLCRAQQRLGLHARRPSRFTEAAVIFEPARYHKRPDVWEL